ncbi:MAG: helix-turn-helix domain-containing protein [Acutalibacteraceae bacterium]
MFINKSSDGTNNVCGKNIASMRKKMNLSQREVADKLQIMGYDIDKNAIQRIESGQRFVTDIEVQALAAVFDVSIPELFKKDLEI